MKKLICILLSFVFLFSLTGCQQLKNKTPPEVPQLEESRKALIQASWEQRGPSMGFPEGITFCDLENRKDGIRYYGSYQYENWNDELITCDILYIPCNTLPVASQYVTNEYSFISHSAFGLYACYPDYDSTSGKTNVRLYPFRHAPYIPDEVHDEVLSQAVETHNAYEQWLYGSVLTQLPITEPTEQMARAQSILLLHTGMVYDLEGEKAKEYWGYFDGFDVFIDWGVAQAVTTFVIAGYEFTFGSACTIYAYKDGHFYQLQHAYKQGLISAETIGRIHDPNNRWKTPACDDSDGKVADHSYRSYTIEPDCENGGSIVYNCRKCYSRYSEILPATGHNYVDGICQNCGKTASATPEAN